MNNDKPQFDIVSRTPIWFAISGVAILIGLVAWAAKGINYGVDFTGGSMYRYALPTRMSEGQVRTHISGIRHQLREAGLKKDAVIQVSDGTILFIRTAERGDRSALVAGVLTREFKRPEGEVRGHLRSEFVGPSIGRELTRQAIMGTVLGLLGIMVWIWIRYNVAGDGFRYAVAGMIALVHDVLVMIGGFAIAGAIDKTIEADSSFVAALLTVVGYSINDTVVIFDRIRENLKHRRRDRFDDIVNGSLWQTMTRSINTVLTVLFALIVLFWFGGESIRSFSLAMLIGIASGAYSSILIASPILIVWKRWGEKNQALAGAVPPRRTPTAVATVPAAAPLPAPNVTSAGAATRMASGEGAATATETAEEAERRRRAARKQGGRRKRF